MNREKMLILSLGTGKINEKNEAGYRSTQYIIEGKPYCRNGIETKTNFVAETLVDFVKPDIIVILGTVKSLWHQFFASLITKDNDDKTYMSNPEYVRLCEIEKGNGIDTDSMKLEEYSKEITSCFAKIDNWKKYSEEYMDRKPEIHIMLTKYGVNEEELRENYGILKKVECLLKPEVSYEVSFDITHSFRSLPIYNLIILNYIRNITGVDLSISHIYYGNIDASYELGGRAPIVDLKDLVSILNLTSGVAEFKNTGCSASIHQILGEQNPLQEKLREFDVAVQMNSFNIIKDKLGELQEVIQQESEEGVLTGVCEMINTVLREKFFNNGTNINNLESISDTDLKFQLTHWYFSQNRMGIGLATGLEALRDLNTPAFVKARHLDEKNERKYRENAETYFIKISEHIRSVTDSEHRSELQEAVLKLGEALPEYKKIRNMSAHSLDSPLQLSEIIQKLEHFYTELFELKKRYDENKDEYIELFMEDMSLAKKNNSNSAKVIIELTDTNCEAQQYLKYKKKKTSDSPCDVFCLSQEVRKKLFHDFGEKKYKAEEKGWYLKKYLQKQLSQMYETIQIIFVGNIESKEGFVLRVFLELLKKEGVNVTFYNERDTLCDLGKIGLHLSKDEYEMKFESLSSKYKEMLEKELIRV